jgi:hypothetical protein
VSEGAGQTRRLKLPARQSQGQIKRVCLGLVDDGQWRLGHEAAKCHEGAEHEVREGGCPIASWSSRFASFAPLRRRFVFQTPRSNQFQIHPNQTVCEAISHNKWRDTRQTVDEGHPFIDRFVKASEPPSKPLPTANYAQAISRIPSDAGYPAPDTPTLDTLFLRSNEPFLLCANNNGPFLSDYGQAKVRF